MKAAQRVHFSLVKTQVEKLIVCCGTGEGVGSSLNRDDLPLRVSQHLLKMCQPAPSDVHNPDVTRAHGRDRQGRARPFYAAQTAQARRARHGRVPSLRSPQTWDSSRVPDVMGVWCDRLLLGDARQPSRTAILVPCVPAPMWGDAVARVAQSHRQLRAEDVLVVSACAALPYGVVRLHTGSTGAPVTPPTRSGLSLPGSTTLSDALRLFRTSSGTAAHFLMGIGPGDDGAASASIGDAADVGQRIVPLCSFAAALWTVNPTNASRYVAALTPTPAALTDACANHRLWRTMQHSMLSTRDTAVLDAHYRGVPLDARLSLDKTRYLAETLLHRLSDDVDAPP
ncbi:hypothetical protein NESM_000672800 [Novymonas esmeraldas]|uniref:Uncharacterized protein n=1 Tax=Novymonas esmeraldas TaxID=1808958 RepID=A0AAW0EWG9_9TRYP